MNFWQKLKRPFTVLAPMEDVTDTVFRQIVVRAAPPDVFVTEFTNVEGLCSEGYEQVARRLRFIDTERPITAQIWGLDPTKFLEAAKMIVGLGFDGIDINMGCPVRDVIRNGACSALIRNHTLAAEIIAAVKGGAGELPVSVKTRIGFNQIQTEEWGGFLLAQGLDALAIHGRTVKESSEVPAHWDEIAKIVKIRDMGKYETVIIGNGDVKDVQEARVKSRQFGVDGVMIGRGVFDNLWCFGDYKPSREDNLKMLIEHLELWDETWGDRKNFAIMKKFFKMYIRGWEGAGELRSELMAVTSLDEAMVVLKRS